MNKFLLSTSAIAAALIISSSVFAGEADQNDTIIVPGQRDNLKLDGKSDTASRLGLTVGETPATVETLTQADLQVQGLRTSREAFNSVVGAISGNVPATRRW